MFNCPISFRAASADLILSAFSKFPPGCFQLGNFSCGRTFPVERYSRRRQWGNRSRWGSSWANTQMFSFLVYDAYHRVKRCQRTQTHNVGIIELFDVVSGTSFVLKHRSTIPRKFAPQKLYWYTGNAVDTVVAEEPKQAPAQASNPQISNHGIPGSQLGNCRWSFPFVQSLYIVQSNICLLCLVNWLCICSFRYGWW